MSNQQKLAALQILGAKASIPTLNDFLSFVKLNNLARQERFYINFGLPSGMPLDVLNDTRFLTLLCEQASIPAKNINARTLRINGVNEYYAGAVDFGGDGITLQFLVDGNYRVREIMDSWMDVCVNSGGADVRDSSLVSGRNEVGFYKDYVSDITLYALMPAGIPGESLFTWSPTQADIGLNNGINALRKKNGALGALASRFAQKVGQKIDSAVVKAKSNLSKNIPTDILEAFQDTETVVFGVNLVDCWPRSINATPLGYDAIGVTRLSVTFSYRHYVILPSNASSLDSKFTSAINQGITAGAKNIVKGITAGFKNTINRG